jgi:ribosomal-protein-alanine N-acetyltransferase
LSAPVFLEGAGAADVPDLVELERRSFSHPWSEANFREAVSDPSRVSTVVLREARGGGGERRTALVAYCVYQVVADEMHILDLAVCAERQRQGLARWLLAFALDQARRRGAARAFLEVRRSNQPALALYQSLGFRVLAERRLYYRDPGEDALVLEKPALEGSPERLGKDP